MKLLSALVMASILTSTSMAWADTALPNPTGPRPVVTEILTFETTELRRFPGVVAAINQVTLAFQVGGRMVERDTQVGDRVLAGEPLALLDIEALQEDVAAARASLRAAEAQAESARLAYDRVVELSARDIASVSQREAAEAARETSAAAVEAAAATLARAEDAVRFGGLVVPSSGVIVETHAEVGATVVAGQPILTLAADGGREVVIDVPTSHLPLFNEGARFVVEASHDLVTVGGRLRLIEPVTDGAARTHRVHIALDEDVLRLGSLVTVRPDLKSASVLTLPAAAVTADGQVWRVAQDRRLEPVAVTLGEEIEGRVIITDGLVEGDEILVRGIADAASGLIVGERMLP